MLKFSRVLIVAAFVLVLVPQAGLAQWTQLSLARTVESFIVKDSTIFANTYDYHSYRSVDLGTHWIRSDSGLVNFYPSAFAALDSELFVDGSHQLMKSTDDGANWSLVRSWATDSGIGSMCTLGSYLYALYSNGGVWRSSDRGQHWVEKDSGLPAHYVHLLIASGGSLFCVVSHNICRSLDSGNSWEVVGKGLADTTFSSLAANEADVYAGTEYGRMYHTSDNGLSWDDESNGLPIVPITTILANGSTLYAGTNGFGIYLSIDHGGHWRAFNDGSNGINVTNFAALGGYIFAGTGGDGVWRRPATQLAVAHASTPTMTLKQNYPNPFNPTTALEYSLAERSNVLLEVYDMLGRRVTTLIEARMDAGTHSSTFNGGGWPSGVYTVRLSTGTGMQSIRMILNK